MNGEDNLASQVLDWFREAQAWTFENALTWPTAAQGAALLVIVFVSIAARKGLQPRFENLVAQSSLPSLIKSVLLAVLGQTGWIAFIVLNWVTAGVFEQFPSVGSAGLLDIATSLATAWVIIALSAQVIANKFLARLVAVVAWTIAALNIVGLLTPIAETLRAFTFRMGSSDVSLLDLLSGIALLVVLIWVALAIARAIERNLAGMSGVTPRGRVLIGKLARGALVFVAVLVALPTMGINFAALAVFSGALGVGVGIGLQKQVSNLLSGLFLLLDKSVKPGDVIEVGETFGWVKEMTARYVGVVTRDNKEILIPNDDFVVNQVINWSHSDRRVRMEISFGVAYKSDPHEVRRLAAEAAKKPKRVAENPEPICHLTAFGDSSIDFVLRFWIIDPEEGVTNVKGQVLLALWDTFKEHDIEIPFPHRYLILDQTMVEGLKT